MEQSENTENGSSEKITNYINEPQNTKIYFMTVWQLNTVLIIHNKRKQDILLDGSQNMG